MTPDQDKALKVATGIVHNEVRTRAVMLIAANETGALDELRREVFHRGDVHGGDWATLVAAIEILTVRWPQ